MFNSEKDVKATLSLSTVPPATTPVVVAEVQDVQRRTCPDVGGPRVAFNRNLIREFQVQRDQDAVAADSDFGVGPKD